MLLDEIRRNDSRYNYRFYLTHPVPINGPLRSHVSGRIREVGDSFVRIRIRNGYREADDLLIPLHSIVAIKELYSAE
ncbi:hypothetical protein [Gymnodinialimonas sp.]